MDYESKIAWGFGAAIVAIILFALGVTAYPYFAGNKKFLDTAQTYRYADVYFPNGETKTIEIDKWTDYENGEQIQIWSTDGNRYLISSFNAVLRAK